MKKILILSALTLCIGVLFANPTNQIDNWAGKQAEDFASDDVVELFNGNRNGEITFGSNYEFDSGTIHYTSIAALSDSKFVLVYRDNDNSMKGTAVIGSVSGNTITFGSEYIFNNTGIRQTSVTALSSSKFVIAFCDEANSFNGTAIIGNVSGSTISYGSEYVYCNDVSQDLSITALDSSKVAIAYQNGVYGAGTGIIGTISDTNISFGSPYVFNNANGYWFSAITLNSGKFAVTYNDDGNSDAGTAVIGDVSGTNITFGSEYVFSVSAVYSTSAAVLDEDSFVVAYRDDGNGYRGTACVGTVSGTYITFGSEYIFNDDPRHYNISITVLGTSDFVVAYRDNNNSDYGTACVGTVAGSDITYGPEYVYNNAITYNNVITSLNAEEFVIGYYDNVVNNGSAVIGEVIEAGSPPAIPENIEIETIAGNVSITWDEVPGATSYKVYSSELPDRDFTEDQSGSFDQSSWTAAVTSYKLFYYVTALY